MRCVSRISLHAHNLSVEFSIWHGGNGHRDKCSCAAVQSYMVGVTASLVVRLIGLLLVFASLNIVHNVQDEMAEFVVLLRQEIKDSLTRQGMQTMRGLHRKGLAERGKRERVLLSEKAREQVLTVKKYTHLILRRSTGTLVTVAISTVSDGGFHRESICVQTKPAHIPHDMLREVKVQIARWHHGGPSILHTSV